MKILNLFAGFSKWSENITDIIHIEFDERIAKITQILNPLSKVIIEDCYDIEIKNPGFFNKFDLILLFPPCYHNSVGGKKDRIDIMINCWIDYLNNFYNGLYCIENVVPHHKKLYKPNVKLGRHYFWSNFEIPKKEFPRIPTYKKFGRELANIKEINWEILKDLKGKFHNHDIKSSMLRSMIDPKIMEYILNLAIKKFNS